MHATVAVKLYTQSSGKIGIEYNIYTNVSCSVFEHNTEWKENPKDNFTKYWKGWDANITDPDIKDIGKSLPPSLPCVTIIHK